MTSAFTAVNLSQLPPPVVVEQLDFETIFAEMLADLQSRDPVFSALVESDPAYKILEVAAYREVLLRQRVNESAKAVMLAFAQGADLDQIGGNYNVARLVLVPGDPDAIPPTDDVMEADDDYRLRIILSLEGYTTAGSIGSYVYHALSASGDVLDVGVDSLVPGLVNIAVLSRTGTGVPPQATLDAVIAATNAETVRPLCDTVAVSAADVVNFQINAVLDFFPGVGQQQVLDAATTSAQAYATEMHKLGMDITLDGVYAALRRPGVQKVNLSSPAADIPIQWNQAPHCTAINITAGVIRE
ncbi:baseplate assembly protein [Aeromonas sp. WP2-W18-CRE-05]|uniref:baseplate assembly protein n=1 Tax=Aeromonas sp. WP2-W18-CRE-05 TaxID=2675707 RepID=UPI0015DC182D|nr:baseplate J/gp47 family protein [Aeromonas sp. WP2-W18-CRE-05]BBQ26438.1 baseplate assembly protein [Aeromonas sp. WP2-W18-CRE-05]